MRLVLGMAFIALAQQSCDLNQQKTAAPPKPAAARPPLHRFVLPRFPADSAIAFDTQTGQICKTWEWFPSGPDPKPDPKTGQSPQRVIGEFAPTCLSIYQKYPSGPGDGIVVSEDQQDDKK